MTSVIRFSAWIGLLVWAASAQASHTYFVSVAGKDANVGSQVAPWRTIQHACTKVAAGDTVLVETGVYHEAVTILRSMSLQNAPSAKPVIDGTGVAVPSSNAALVLIGGVSNVVVQGFEIRNYKTTNSNLVPAGVFVHGACNAVTIRNNLVHAIENDGTDASRINAFGIAVYGDSTAGAITNLVITGNQVYETKTGNSETVNVDGNVNGFSITNNLVHDVDNIGIDCIGFEGVSPIASEDQARNGLVSGNTVYNVTSLKNPSYGGQQSADGIYVDGGKSIVVERNIVHNVDIGIEVASEHGGKVASDVIARNNLIYLSNVVGLSIGGYSASVGGTLDCSFVNNTFFENDTTNSGSGEFQIQFHTTGNVLKNNILYSSAQGIFISEATSAAPGLVSDYNLYYTTGSPSWSWGPSTYADLKSYVKGSKEDSHSKFASPDFANSAGRYFNLGSASPALDAGVDLGASLVGLYDLAGNPRVHGAKIDLGCYETLGTVP
jgi:uncharacterized protein DUF1565